MFIDRQRSKSKLLIVLAGYKSFLWNHVFSRLKSFVDDDIDVCILVSGKDDNRLIEIAKENNWSYMSTEINNLCFAQNDCITRFPSAQFIFKMDEDIFVTKNCFNKLYDDFQVITEKTGYIPSAIVPLINVNCVTYRKLLERQDLLTDFKDTTGIDPVITNGLHHHVEVLQNPKMAKYMWINFDIDDETLVDHTFSIEFCPVRFSIGLVLFTRKVWSLMGGFPVSLDNELEYKRIGLGEDEKAICVFAMKQSMPISIDNRVLVGHFSYGPQEKEMKHFYDMHQNIFERKQLI